MRWLERDGARWLEAALPGARAVFTTRLGGVSEGSFASLNLGLLTDDEGERVRANRRIAARAAGVDANDVLIGHQVHGADLLIVGEAPSPNPFTDQAAPVKVDGLIATRPGLAPLVFVADCLPVVLSGPRGTASLHCGWRGLAAGIVDGGVDATGATAAAIGPGIGRCCYEVGSEVLRRFAHLGADVADGRWLDLALVAVRLLERAGVADVETAGLCTSCEEELFFSHRRDEGVTGRQAGIAVAL